MTNLSNMQCEILAAPNDEWDAISRTILQARQCFKVLPYRGSYLMSMAHYGLESTKTS